MNYPDYGCTRGFTIHLSTSDLVSMLVVDSEALKNEFHEPGVYDENGDYVPQYSDDPNDLQHIGANSSDVASSQETPAAETPSPVETPSPAETPPPTE